MLISIKSEFLSATTTRQASEISAEGSVLSSELSPLDLAGTNLNVEELQRRISDSFSRKLTEWERRKYRRPTTPDMERKGSRGRKDKDDRSRIKKSREDKERERQEKAREREMQKVEREQVKLEKEKNRIEKERMRAMEREAKLERMKGRLTLPEQEPGPGPISFSPPPASPAPAQLKVSADFARKLQEWEVMKGMAGQEVGATHGSAVAPPEPQFTVTPPGPAAGEMQRPPPLMLQPCFDSPEERSPIDKASDVSYGDDSTSVTEESLTKSNISR